MSKYIIAVVITALVFAILVPVACGEKAEFQVSNFSISPIEIVSGESTKVTLDVLILTGREDHLVPFKMHDKQVKALPNARSVTSRIFMREEQAQNHYQIGNLGLALDVMRNWIEEES